MSEDRTQWHRVERFELESGAVLTGVEQAYRLEGRLNEARDNLVVVFHSLTGTPDVLAWWPEVVGHGLTGMRERANAVGGTLTAGPNGAGRFHVQAVLPLRAQAEGGPG